MYPPYPRDRISALVLAGGQGSRMGGRDKGLLAYRGRPLAARAAAALRTQAATVLLSANRSQADYRALGLAPLPDLRAGFPGPLAGIEAGLAACTTPYLLVCPCDTPHIPADLGPRLWTAMQAAAADACHAVDPLRPHYLHLLLRRDAAAGLAAYLDQGGRAVRHWLAGLAVARAPFAAAELANLNTPLACGA